jgi:DNA-directed RNA polymerase specialized sigma24 family protein
LRERLMECMEEKSVNVQKVFLLRVCGLRTGRIASVTGIPGRSVRRYAHQDVDDVRRILMEWVRPVPEHTWPN